MKPSVTNVILALAVAVGVQVVAQLCIQKINTGKWVP